MSIGSEFQVRGFGRVGLGLGEFLFGRQPATLVLSNKGRPLQMYLPSHVRLAQVEMANEGDNLFSPSTSPAVAQTPPVSPSTACEKT